VPITNEIIQYLTVGNTADPDNADPDLSLGGAVSTVAIVNDTDNNVFDDVAGDESAAGTVEYRCRAVVNTHGTLTLLAPKVWISVNTPATGDTIAIGLGSSGVGTGNEQVIATELIAPISGVTFSSPSTKGAGLSPGDVAAGSHFFIWERRTVTAGAGAYNANTYTINVEGDSAA
jgi:hypothetical protein